MITIKKQVSFSELGRRTNNEDNYGFIEGSSFVVCDGVGGSEKGEIASDIVVSTFLNAYKSDVFSSAQDVVSLSEKALSNYISENPDSFGMATTLTFLQVRPGGIYVAWVGDSRIYQFRNGEIIFQTRDHSWVNEALDAGILTPEEAINHPKGNIITRAIQGEHKSVQVQDEFLANVQSGDIFFLCSDGVLESWTNDDLSALMGQSDDLLSLEKSLKSECALHSRDNHTAIILQIESNVPKERESTPIHQAIPIESEELDFKRKDDNKNVFRKLLAKKVVLWLVLAGVIGIAGYYAFKSYTSEKQLPTKPDRPVKVAPHKVDEKEEDKNKPDSKVESSNTKIEEQKLDQKETEPSKESPSKSNLPK